MEVTMKVEGLDEALKNLAAMPKQVRFGASIGLNRTMNEAQDAIRASLGAKFTLRRSPFVLNTIYRKPGEDFPTATTLEARVRVHDDRNQLAKFEDGGTKEPTRGRKMLAVPVSVRRNKNDIVTKANSVKALLASGKAYMRDGKVWLLSGRGKTKTRTLAYIFKRSVPTPKKLGFVEVGTKTIAARAKDNIEGAIVQNLTTGLNVTSRG